MCSSTAGTSRWPRVRPLRSIPISSKRAFPWSNLRLINSRPVVRSAPTSTCRPRTRDWTRVRDYSARMGERAQRMYAPALAVESFGRALEAAHALGERSLGQLYRLRAQAYEVLG